MSQFSRYVKKGDRAAVKGGMNIRYRCIVAVTLQADQTTTIDEGTEHEYTTRVDPVLLVSIDVTENNSWDDCSDLAQEYAFRTTGRRGYSTENLRCDRRLKTYM